MHNILILVRGLPGSGKSTHSNSEKYNKFIHCESDHYFLKGGEYVFDRRELYTSHAYCQFKAFNAMLNGFDVIVANTFTQIPEILPYIRFAQDNGIKWKIVECYGKWQNVHGTPEEIMLAMKTRWEPLEILVGEEGFAGFERIHLTEEKG